MFAACDHSPVAPTPPPGPVQQPNVTIASISVAGETRSSSYAYRVVVHLRESSGVAATISAVDLTFTSGTATVASSHTDRPISDTTNICPANGTVDTREITTVQNNISDPYATAVQARVTFTDGASYTSSTGGSATVPPQSGPPPPQSYTLTGVITDASTHARIVGARLDVLTGINAGKTALTDGTGTYAFAGLLPDTFRLRASADGYATGEQGVTVPANPQADFELRAISSACAYAVDPTGSQTIGMDGGQLNVSVARTSGTCGWQASTDANWLTLSPSSGSGTATLTISFGPNVTRAIRTGTVTIQWSGGGTQLVLTQPPELLEPICILTPLTVNGQNPLAVPAGGGQYTASINVLFGVYPPSCGGWKASAGSGITFPGQTSGPAVPAAVTFVVSTNTSTAARVLLLDVSTDSGANASLTINQAGGP